MNTQHAFRQPNPPKKSRTHDRDEHGKFARLATRFCDLPTEIQVLILIKAAVTSRLSGETFGEVYEALAPVSKLWKELIRAPWFYDQVRQQAYQKGELGIFRI